MASDGRPKRKSRGGRFSRQPRTWSEGRAPDMFVVEDDVVVTDTGSEILTPLPKDPWIAG